MQYCPLSRASSQKTLAREPASRCINVPIYRMSTPINVPTGAWLYVAMDVRHPCRTKLGFTLGREYARTGPQTANPGMMPVVHLPLPADEGYQIEQHLHGHVGYRREPHCTTGSRSEWYACTPGQLVNSIKGHYVNCWEDGYLLFCDDVPNRLYTIATFPPVGHFFLTDLSWRTTEEEFNRYVAAYNDVRVELGLPAATDDELYGISFPTIRVPPT